MIANRIKNVAESARDIYGNKEPKIYRNLENCSNLNLICNIQKKMYVRQKHVGQNVLDSKGKTSDLYGIVKYYDTLCEFYLWSSSTFDKGNSPDNIFA